MTVIASIEAVALVAVVWLLLRHQATERAAGVLERQQLADRIQQPDRLPSRPVDTAPIPAPEPDEYHLVGRAFDPEPKDE